MYFLKAKSDTGVVIRDFVAVVERQFNNAKILSLLTDGGGEYVNGQLLNHLNMKEIKR